MEFIYDLIIVGAGPAGLAAALNAHKSGLRYLLLEKEDHIADTTHGYQRGKLVMAEPGEIPLRGDLGLLSSSREVVLQRWEEAVRAEKINLALQRPVSAIRKNRDEFEVVAGNETLRAAKVILAVGNQGNPRRLAVPGEFLPHVHTRLADPANFSDQDIVVVGGGDSAIEIALALAARNRVTIAVRTSEFVRAKDVLERNALAMARRGELTIHFNANVDKIEASSVTLRLPTSSINVLCQVVFVKIGALPPRHFLENCGISFADSEADALPHLSVSYETEVSGLFLIGTANARAELIKHAINQGHDVVEHICGRRVEPIDEAILSQKLDFFDGPVSARIEQLVNKAPLLANASESQIRDLLRTSRFHRVAAGDIVFRQNDYSDTLYVVLEGTLAVLSKLDNAEESSVAIIGPGEFFGEMNLISGRRRSASIKASSEAFLLEVNRKAMLRFLRLSPTAKAIIDKTFLVRAFQSYLFPQLDHSILEKIAESASVVNFDRDQVILSEGEEGDSFYLIRSGMAKLFRQRHNREIVLAYLSAGQYFGEISLLTGSPRVASAAAIGRVEVIRVARRDFMTCVDSSPDLKKRLEQEAERRHMRFAEIEVRPELAELGRFMTSEEVVIGDNVLLIDENRCIQCDQCVHACEAVHDDGQTRIKRTGMRFANVLVANSCRHCENPLCMTDCPPGDAIARDPRGEVYIRDNCIGCGNCAAQCPYDNIFMAEIEAPASAWDRFKAVFRGGKPEVSEVKKSLPVKCDLCRDLKGGPACVRGCPTGAVLRLTPAQYNQTIESLAIERKESL